MVRHLHVHRYSRDRSLVAALMANGLGGGRGLGGVSIYYSKIKTFVVILLFLCVVLLDGFYCAGQETMKRFFFFFLLIIWETPIL